MNLVDSSAWMEFLTGAPNASRYETPIKKTTQLVVPTIVLMEVWRYMTRWHGRQKADLAAAYMMEGLVIPLDETLALSAAQMGLDHKLPLADSVVLATARTCEAVLWTQDSHFSGIAGVKYFAKS
ncbi:MAG: type II toxin-antitoxin system VapC family toxin [Acidimicrobiia bacterium]|nr:type II toxin-antitoxin system VapC family toxin [Acidimicrobiia bacterium]